jgi:acetamidase/formamidase
LVEDGLVFFGDPHAAISDGIITGTGIECSTTARARINLSMATTCCPAPT